MVLNRAYFDASGAKDDPNVGVLVVAGYVASADAWDDFDAEWPSILAEFGVTCLHMKDFAHCKGEFKQWKEDEDRRRLFLSRLAEVVGTHTIRGFSITVDLHAYRRAARMFDMPGHLDPYPLAVSAAIRNVEDWIAQAGVGESLYILERGDDGQGSVEDALKFFGVSIPASPTRLEKSWQGADGSVEWCYPFQACDYLAYEHAKVAKQQQKKKFNGTLRGSLRALMGATKALDYEVWYFGLPTYIALCVEHGFPSRG